MSPGFPQARHPVEPASQETDEPFRLLVEQVVDYAIYMLDLGGRVSSWNIGGARIKGYEPREILGSHFSVFFTEEDRARGAPDRVLEAATRNGRHEEEGWRVRKDGTRFWAHAVVTALRDERGQARGFVKITRDLTERLRADEGARRLTEERSARQQAERIEQERQTMLRRQANLSALRAEVSGLAAAGGDARSLIDLTVRAVVERLGVAGARLWIFDERGQLRTQARAGVTLPFEAAAPERVIDVVARIAASGAPASIDDLSSDPAFGDLPGSARLAFAGCPLIAVRHTLGVLGVFGAGPLPGDLLDVLRSVADVVAQSLARQRADAEVRRSRDRLAVILSTITDGVTAQGRDGRLIFANDAAARQTGFASGAHMVSADVRDILARFEIRDEHGRILRPSELPGHHAMRGQPARATVRFRDLASGVERWSEIAAAPVMTDAGEVELAVNVFTDLTERKRTEDAWRFLAEAGVTFGASLSRQDILEAVAQQAVPAIADWCIIDVLDEQGTIQTAAMAHTDPDELATVREFRRQRPRLTDDPGVPRVIASGQPEILGEIPDTFLDAVTSTPEQREMLGNLGLRSAMIVPLTTGDRPVGALTFVSSQSGRRFVREDLILAQEIARRAALALENARAYREAREAVEARDTFLSIASHELKTPLSSLTLLLSGLLRVARAGRLEELGNDKVVARLARIEDQADRLTALMNQLLDVTRLAAGRFALLPVETDLVEVAMEVLARFGEEAGQAGASLRLIEPGPVRGLWDRSRLDQVVTNLLTNALKYGGGSPVTVEVGGDPSTAWLSVSDRGPGISESDQARIFDQYERAASTNLGGLGLGLWIVKQVVHAHRGEVRVRSLPGEGATFTFTLPRR
jgi:PAS domain S-box-containing protein